MQGMSRHRELNGGRLPGFQEQLPIAIEGKSNQPQDIKLYAIVSTWFDADVIEATVKNCFELGCERVYLIDNASPDNTVELAIAAGATLAQCYTTEKYDDDYRSRLQNDLIVEVTQIEKHPNLWWLTLDSDELPTLPLGETLLTRLSVVPEAVNAVGSNFFDLYPTERTQYISGLHPATCMEMGVWRRGGINRYCQCGHWKHPLIKLSNGVCNIGSSRGNHAPAVIPGSLNLFEPEWTLTTFHAPIRNEEQARARLNALCSDGRNEWDDQVTDNNGAIRRFMSLTAIYEHRWGDVQLAHTQMYGRPVTGLTLYPWRRLIPELVTRLEEQPCVQS